ncbi:NADP-dependent oxidoreductase [Micromonospora sp. NBC_01699]|uniref:NADP-dependent oxidoreductase n=1 Tax=Micromonospora sp. NBC_01699 TaxID=2975984 RepID=UPI002E2C6643|nr:NADP-dependent oxidoreductase [Micromonospora sp. NBC_01699]
MQAVAVTAQGGPEVLQVIERPDPVPGPGQVLVRVLAAVVHPADVAARLGLIPGGPVEPPFLPGWDFAGEVVEVGDGGGGEYRPGDRVVGMVPWYRTRGAVGAYAELIAADADWVVPLPDGLAPTVAATVPLNALTARQALDLMELPPASTVLVTGASGGVGGFAAQLAVRAGHRVLAVAGRDDEDWVRDLGVAQVVPKEVDLAGIGPVPAVLDAVPLAESAAVAVVDGGILLTTRPTPPVDPARGVRQQVVLIRFDRELLRELIVEVARGRLRTRVATTLPLARAAEAHRIVEAGGVRGKVVLTP